MAVVQVRSGTYRDVVEILRPPEPSDALFQDASGQPTSDYTPGNFISLGTRRAKITPGFGQEKFSAQEVKALTTVFVEMRYDPRVTSVCRFKSKGITYEIQAVMDRENRQQKLEIMGKEVG